MGQQSRQKKEGQEKNRLTKIQQELKAVSLNMLEENDRMIDDKRHDLKNVLLGFTRLQIAHQKKKTGYLGKNRRGCSERRKRS